MNAERRRRGDTAQRSFRIQTTIVTNQSNLMTTKPKMRTVKLYLHIADDLFLPSIIVSARRKRPAAHSRPPVLTHRQWALWWLVSGLAAGRDELFQSAPTVTMLMLTIEKRMETTPWQHVEVHMLPGGCFRVIGKTTSI